MKASIVVLSLLVGAAQTVAAADCCCFVVCEHRNQRCDDCGHSKEKPAVGECCSKESPVPEPSEEGSPCTHVEPSGEIVHQAADLVVAPPADVPAPAAILPVPPGCPKNDRHFSDTRGSPPLFILHHALLR